MRRESLWLASLFMVEFKLMRFVFFIVAVLAFSCSSQRKLSQYGMRQPSSVAQNESPPMEYRTKFREQPIPASCSKEMADFFPSIVEAKIVMPGCPAFLRQNYLAAKSLLSHDEKNTIEEILKNECRSANNIALDSLVFDNSFSTTLFDPAAAKNPFLLALKNEVQNIIRQCLPVDRWITRSGEYLLNEQSLQLLDTLLVKEQCKIGSAQAETIFRTLRYFEELLAVLPAGDQKQLVEKLYIEVQKVVDDGIKELFFHDKQK